MEHFCDQCRKVIGARARANVWAGERVVCTPCLHELTLAATRAKRLLAMVGRAFAPWMVRDGRRQQGPYSTDQLIGLFGGGRVPWECEIHREGMAAWVPVARLFTVPDLANGRVELREFGQGDGTSRLPPHAERR